MNKILLFLIVAYSQIGYAQQNSANCKSMLAALPTHSKFKKFTLLKKDCEEDKMVVAFYGYGSHDEQQILTVSITDGKHPANEGKIGDAQTKYEMIKAAKPIPSSRISNIKLGTHGFEAYDINEGIKRVYGYNVILKNRFIFEFLVNNSEFKNLDDLRAFVADYILKLNLDALKDKPLK